MNERQSDFEWLQQFARVRNQNAFREIVRRHIDLVFATALRKVGDAGGAEEISQNVFSILARKAWQFAPDDSLPAWLHKTALLESKSWLRGELRRRRREQTAAELGTTMKTPDEQPAFSPLVPLLDEALLSLRETDRAALLLRYYENQSLRNVGAALGVNDDTAQKRVASALEKLSQFFQRRGFKTTVAATAAALQHSAISASATTVSIVSNFALQAAPPALMGLSALLARFASLTKVQTAVVCVAIATVPVVWKWEQSHASAKQIEALELKLNKLQAEHEQAAIDVERLRSDFSRLEQKQSDAVLNPAREEEARRKLSILKEKSRALLTADNYRWPDDLPFVRVPKSALASIKVAGGPNTPERLATKVNQFLDLSPSEREKVGQIFFNYFTEIDRLMETSLYETNRAMSFSLPAEADSKVFVLLPMGEKIRAELKLLSADLESALGSDRWAMVKPDSFEFTHYEQVRLLGCYTKYAWDQTQEIAINIYANDSGEPKVSWMASGGTGSSPMLLRFFLQDGLAKTSSRIPTFNFHQGPPMHIERVKRWLAAEAVRRLKTPVTP